MMKRSIAIGMVYLILCSATVQATVTFDWATVGDPGNPPEDYWGYGEFFGSVAYTYRISKYEVTNAQYTEFLNAVDAMGTNPNTIYNSFFMGADVRGGIVFNAGAPSGSKYSTKVNMGNKPVMNIKFFDAMRFTNWLENGQPTDGSGTETGVYSIGNGINETRAIGASYFIPSEDEWYKAAYYQPADQGGDADGYWLFPTRSNSAPTMATADAVGNVNNPGANVANYNYGADWNGQDGNFTTVGSAGSASFYGTFDQGGNVWEFNETVISSGYRGLRGGDFHRNEFTMAASTSSGFADRRFDFWGFRVASSVESLGLNGDYNQDGEVDAADYVLWRNDPTSYGGDPVGYNTWRANFGQTGGSGVGEFDSIPEPSTLLVLLLAGIALMGRRRR
jgi:formylglycine-generating enzyme required for sulfatase activity